VRGRKIAARKRSRSAHRQAFQGLLPAISPILISKQTFLPSRERVPGFSFALDNSPNFRIMVSETRKKWQAVPALILVVCAFAPE